MLRTQKRWFAVAVLVAILIAMPDLYTRRPLHAQAASASTLLAQVRHSRSLSYSGLVAAQGDLSLPSLPGASGLAGLLSSTTRLRVWWSSNSRSRVDQLSDDGEDDTITNGTTVVTWDSTREAVDDSMGIEPLRTPRAGDLLPPALAARLTPTDLAARATRLPATRIAGRTALGLRLTPIDSTTTVGSVDIDVDQTTGLPLRIAVTARGRSTPSFSSEFSSVDIGPPAPDTLGFETPPGAIVRSGQAPDVVADANRYAPFQLPDSLAGLPRTQRVDGLNGNGGAATYGRGYSLLALLPLQHTTAQRVIHALQPPIGAVLSLAGFDAQAVEEPIPLANVLAVEGGDRAYLLTGTVIPAVLRSAATQLLAHPPPFRPRPTFDPSHTREARR